MTVKVDGTNGLLQNYDYQAPTTGFSYTFSGYNMLVMNPAGTLATGTITMPASPVDGMTITFSSSQQITALTVNANTGQSIVGGGSLAMPAGGSYSFIYRLSSTTWYQAVSVAQPLTNIQQFDAGGGTTWTKPTGGQTMVKIQVWAGGGGGGRGGTANSAGGGGGAYNEFICPLSYMGATATVTVGAAGVGRTGSSGNGTAGGNSSVVIASYPSGSKTIIAYGGGGGGATNANAGGGGLLGAGTTASTTPKGGKGYAASSAASAAYPVAWSFNQADTYQTGDPTAGGGGASSWGSCSVSNVATGGIYGGGGSSSSGTAGNSYYGGGGGVAAGTAGVSFYGGNGGLNAAGTTPAGGGGASPTANTNGFDGGAGRVVITSW